MPQRPAQYRKPGESVFPLRKFEDSDQYKIARREAMRRHEMLFEYVGAAVVKHMKLCYPTMREELQKDGDRRNNYREV
jgi:hypothetical protein